MSLPTLPLLTGDDHTDLQTVYQWIYSLIRYFPNAVGNAIDPSMGQGGDESLTVTEAPTAITYSSSSSLSVDGTLFGQIDITFTKPDRAVNVIAYYKEHSDTVYKQSTLTISPSRIISLKVGVQYDIQIAGQSANNSIGPLSPLVNIVVDTSAIAVGMPTNLQATGTYQSVVLTWDAPVGGALYLYQVQRATDSLFTVGVVNWLLLGTKFTDTTGTIGVTYWYRVRSVDKAGGLSSYTIGVSTMTANVLTGSIGTAQIADKAVTFAKMQDIVSGRVLGRTTAGNGPIEVVVANTGWSTAGVAVDKAVVGGSATPEIAKLQDILGTLVNTLTTQGMLSP